MAVTFSDTFSYSDGSLYTVSGGVWTDAGTGVAPSVSSGQLVGNDSGLAAAVVTASLYVPADGYAELLNVQNGASASGHFCSILMTVNGDGNGYRVGWSDSSCGIYRIDSAVSTLLGSAISPPSNGQRVRFAAYNGEVLVYYDNVLVASRSDSTYSHTGFPGVYISGTSAVIDNYACGDFPVRANGHLPLLGVGQ